jgi:hypothetical protein
MLDSARTNTSYVVGVPIYEGVKMCIPMGPKANSITPTNLQIDEDGFAVVNGGQYLENLTEAVFTYAQNPQMFTVENNTIYFRLNMLTDV